jgi:Tol biopolymer transport system component/DNA-binding winged helix-turn-helix (wHTH) protein
LDASDEIEPLSRRTALGIPMVLEFNRRAEQRTEARDSPAVEFRIADRRVQPHLNRICTASQTFQVEPKIMRVLLCLATLPGQVVTREDLIEEVWEGAFVTDDVLTRSIGELRRIFEDDPGSPRVIETIRKRGYRLIAPVQELPDTPGEAEDGLAAAEPPPRAPLRTGPQVIPLTLAALAVLVLAGVLGLRFLSDDSPRGSGPRRVVPLTSFPGNEFDPALSPDGSRVAFVWDTGNGEVDLWVKLTNSETPLRLTASPGAERAPVWSPDGSRLAFARLEGEDCGIFTVPSIGGPERRLTACGYPRAPDMAWSPDGHWLALTQRNEGGRYPVRLQLLSVDTLEQRDLTRPSEDYLGDYAPAFAPDGRSVAFARVRGGGAEDLYVVPVEGGEVRRLTHDNRHLTGLAWSSSGREIIFSSDRAGTYSLWKVPVAGGPPQWIAGGGSKMKDPSASRQGQLLAAESWLYEINIWRTPLGSTAAERQPEPVITSTLQWDFEPQFSPDGRHIAFGSSRSGSHEIWVAGGDGSHPMQLTSFGGPHTGMPRWSADGERLVLTAMPEGQADLYTISASGGVPLRLTSHPQDEVAPSWSRDGRWVYFGSRRTGTWQIWKVATDGEQVIQVTRHGGYAAFEAPEGAWLYHTRIGAPGIWRVPVNGGEETLVVDGLQPDDWANWAVSEAGIHFLVRSDSDTPSVAHLPYGASQPVIVGTLEDMSWGGVSVSPDSRWLLHSRTDRREADLLLVENY